MTRLLILLALVLQEPAREKIELRVRPVQGDRIEITETSTHTLRGLLGDEPLNTASRGGRRLVVEMAGVEGGVLVKKVVKVEDAYIESQDVKTSKFIRQDSPLHGRTATVERRGGREVFSGLDGVPEAEQKTIGLEDPLTRLFPDKPVAVGDSWEISGEGLKKFFPGGDFTDGAITISLRDIQDVGGRRCAYLRTLYDVKAKSADGAMRALTLNGTLTVWIERGYVLAMSASGRMTTTGADPKTGHPNGVAAVTGELKATILEKTK